MKAFVVSEYAHPSKIHLTHNAPEPVLKPGSDDLLIDVHSAGLNFFDVRFPRPVRPTVSHTSDIKIDIAVPGKISDTTSASVRIGRRVCWNRSCCAIREPLQAW